MTDRFNRAEYTVHFDSVFTNKRMSSAFRDFLATEHNLEPWKFLQDVVTLEKITNQKEQVKKTKQIIKKYIEVNSEDEINISVDIRNGLTNLFKPQDNSETWILEKTPKELFSDIYYVVVNMLRHDTFKRFVRTSECESVMKQFKHDSTVVSPAITNDFSYDDEFFTHPFFRDRDIDFFLSLFEDSYDWEVSSNSVFFKIIFHS